MYETEEIQCEDQVLSLVLLLLFVIIVVVVVIVAVVVAIVLLLLFLSRRFDFPQKKAGWGFSF